MKNQKNNTKKNLIFLFSCIIIIVVIVYGLTYFVVKPYIVNGDSMNPYLENKDLLIISRTSYSSEEPKRFDVIVFPDEKGKQKDYVKRIIGLPGETIQVYKGDIYVNGKILEENYGNEKIDEDGDIAYPVVLGDDEYFVLGDNRNNAADSRFDSFGMVYRQNIIGKVVFRLLPISDAGSLE